MAQFYRIHSENPQARLVGQAAAALRRGGVAAYPTDSCYALCCLTGNKPGLDRIARIRRLRDGHPMTLVCHDLSEIGLTAVIDNVAFRLIKSVTPGPFTFILRARRSVPRRLQHARRKTIGIRIPDNRIALALLDALGEPLLSSSLMLPGRDSPETDPGEILDALGTRIDVIIDGGIGGTEMTTVVDLTGTAPVVSRQGKGRIAWLEPAGT